jgi:hypothetical protein
VDYAEAIEKIRTDPGVSRDELPSIAAGILALTGMSWAVERAAKIQRDEQLYGADLVRQAAEMARTTLYSYDDCLAELIAGRPHPFDPLLRWAEEMLRAPRNFLALAERRARCSAIHSDYRRRSLSRHRRR